MSSLWLSASRTPMDTGELPSSADVAIAGAGLLGVSCAYWLARMGATVVVVEKQAVGWGATGRNGGLIIPTTSEAYDRAVARLGAQVAAEVRRLAVEGARLVEQIVAEEEVSCGYRPDGFLQLALNEQEAAGCRAEVDAARQHGFEAAWLDRDTVQSRLGTRLNDTVAGALRLPGAAVNSVALVEGIATAARRHGARIFTGLRVDAVRSQGGHALVDTTAGTIRARVAITALNAWLADLVPGMQRLIQPVQGQVIAISPVPQVFPCGMGADLTEHGEYWQQQPDGSIVLGGCRSVAAAPADPLAQSPQPAVHEALQSVLPTLFPDFGPVRAERGWAGAMAFTRDRLPIVDRVDEPVWAIGGFSGHGMPFGASIGKLLAAHILTGSDLAEVSHLRINRPTLAA